MSVNALDDPKTGSTNQFLAILNRTQKKEIVITEDEYLALKELRRMKVEQRHLFKMFSVINGALVFYDVGISQKIELKTGVTLP